MGLYEELKALEPFTLSCHHDPDGIYSAILLTKIFEIKGEIKLPEFGEYYTQVAVDLGFPTDTAWDGVCVDHHPDHPLDRKYKLFWDYCPTGLVLYKNLKEYIPPEWTWLVVGSLVGDGQPELTPVEIWKQNPSLLNGRGSISKYGFKTSMYDYPTYVYLSSGLNSICRLGFPEQAVKLLSNMTDPMKLLENTEILDARERMRKEEASVYSNKPVVEKMNNFKLVRIKTSKPEIRICGIIGAQLTKLENTTTFVILNETSGECSIRGNLAKVIAGEINANGFKAGGHAAFCGCKVPQDEVDNFIRLCRNLRIT